MDFEPMSPEEIERTVQFLLRQQAQFAADFERLSHKVEQLSDRVGGLSGTVESLTAKTDRMAEGIIGLTGIVGRIANLQERSDERLQAVIDMFERHLHDDHGARPS